MFVFMAAMRASSLATFPPRSSRAETESLSSVLAPSLTGIPSISWLPENSLCASVETSHTIYAASGPDTNHSGNWFKRG